MEAVSATQIRTTRAVYRISRYAAGGAYEIGRRYNGRSINAAAVAKIRSGELKGWRQKPWGTP